MSLFIFALYISFFSVISLESASAQSDWKKIFTTTDGSEIDCGFFFDENTGFIGSGIRDYAAASALIYKTTDGGKSWKRMQTPFVDSSAVTSIFMVDQKIGYASIFATEGSESIWKTINGGNSWSDISPSYSGFAPCVYATSKAIILTQWGVIAGVSIDGGANFNSIFSGAIEESNGIDFTDDLHGVVTMGPEMPPNSTPISYYTSDGGLNWRNSNFLTEAWSVYGLKGTLSFFAAGEGAGITPANQHTIFRSDDGGATWIPIYTFPFSPLEFTGHIGGWGKELYIQSVTNSAAGLYRSDDLGNSWKNVGGPSNSRDTRFVVTGCSGQVVYAFDEAGNVWKTTTGGDSTLGDSVASAGAVAVQPTTVSLNTLACSDSARFTLTSIACPTVFFDSARVVSSNDAAVDTSQFGAYLRENDSLSVFVRYTPLDTGSKNETVLVYLHSGSRQFVDTVALVLRSDQKEIFSALPDSLNFAQHDCSYTLDSMTVGISSCSTLVIDSLEITDSSFILDIPLPDTLLFGSGVVPILYHSDTNSTHKALMHLYGHAALHAIDTLVSLSGNTVLPPPKLSTSADSLSFATKYCAPVYDSISFSNSNCDPVIIDSIVSNAPFLVGAPLNGVSISLGKPITLGIAYIPLDSGSATGSITIYGHSGAGKLVTVTKLTGYNKRGKQTILISTDSIALRTSNCSQMADSLFFLNQGCDGVTLDSVVSFDGSVTSHISSITPLQGGDSTVVSFEFVPDSGLVRSGLIHFFYHVGTSPFDTTINCSLANVVSPIPLTLSVDSLNLNTDFCQPTGLPLLLSNLTCLDMTLDSVHLFNDSLLEFGYDTTSANLIRSLDSGTMRVSFSPSERGKRTGSIELFLHYGNHSIDTVLALSGDNNTSPEPYLAPIPTGKAADTIGMMVMLRPTVDTFTMKHVSFHLRFNTDLITPVAVSREYTLSATATNVVMTLEPGNGMSFSEDLPQPITQDSNLTEPLVMFRSKVFLTKTGSTPVTLDSFATDTVALEPLCSIPLVTFVSTLACGDTTIRSFMLGSPIDIISIHPNPAPASSSVEVLYSILSDGDNPEMNIIDSRGSVVQTIGDCPGTKGTHTLSLTLLQPSGEYQIVLKNASSQTSKKFLIEK